MKKKLFDMTYEKKDGELKDYSIFIVNTGPDFIAGFNVSAMSEYEKNMLIDLQEEYEINTKPFMKYYRRFSTDKIVPEE